MSGGELRKRRVAFVPDHAVEQLGHGQYYNVDGLHPSGERYKWKALNELQESTVADFTLSFLKVTPLCQDAAFARYEVFVKFPPKATVRFEKILVGEIWVKREGQWKALHYQETRVK